MSETMTSRERALAAFGHKPIDRVLLNYLANQGIDQRLKAHYGLKADDCEGLMQKLGVDFRTVHPGYVGERLHPEVEGIVVDPVWGMRTKWIEHDSGGYYDLCEWPLRGATLDEVAAWPMPDPDDYDYDAMAKAVNAQDEYCMFIGGAGVGDVINTTARLQGMEDVLIGLITDDPATQLLVQRRNDIYVEIMRRGLEAARGRVDVLWIGEDLGTQIGPMVSMDMFRQHIRPRLQAFVDIAKQWNIPVMIHSCGSSSWAFDDFIEMGIDVADTLQPEAANMEPAYMKERYGDKLAFHGIISTAGVLATGSVADVEACVRETLEIMIPGSGYVLAPTHQIQDNTPTENVVAMYDAAKAFFEC